MTSDPLEGVRSAFEAWSPPPEPVPIGEPFYGVLIDRRGNKVVQRCQQVKRGDSTYLDRRNVPRSTVVDLEALPVVRDNRPESNCAKHGEFPNHVNVVWRRRCTYLLCADCDQLVNETISWSCDGHAINFTNGWSSERVDLPLLWHLSEAPYTLRTCARCGTPHQIHAHHWAPQAFFNDADQWGTVDLCQTCHAEWHQVMTPPESYERRSTA